ncbi:hypothetical protein SAMN05216578_10989 [Halopseudomonas formosensis]|uniref:TspB protein n=1 Tax=Halopseudomonas formosensis TaxID=1002526 RepID=A0A1I6BZP2_9GAMM|nr:virulence factor TspB C-terminal domain-related protein [Halopseudomonas formosensis]SFQ86374.1 hypothetical protein SAMN05216578_10989 [Halopseudomonas formosensis]
MVLARFVLLAAVLLAASSVSAAEIIDLGPSDYRNFGSSGAHTSSGIRSSFGQTVRVPPSSLNTLTVTRNPVIPYGSVANGLKNFVRVNPASVAASAAVTGLFLAVDWAWDELTQEWVKYEMQCPVGAICAIDGNYHPMDMCRREPYALTSIGEVKTITASGSFRLGGTNYPAGTVVSVMVAPHDASTPGYSFLNNCTSRYPSGNWPTKDGSFPQLRGMIITEPGVPELLPAPVDFSELEAQLPALPPGQVAEAAGDAQRRIGNPLPGYTDTTISGPSSIAGPETTSTSTDPVTGDTVVTTTQTTTNITYGDTTITTTNTTTTNTYTNGTHTSTETTTETPGELPVTEPSPGGAAGEWPGFCDWASVVCSFIEWFQEPFDAPEVEWPLIEDQDYEEEFDFTLAASCPEPYTIELGLFPPVQFNWQPFCDLATFIRPLVLASAAIFAAFISLGIARARN